MSKLVTSLSEEALSSVSAGADISASFSEITVILEPGENAYDLPGQMSLPLGLKLDAYSNDLLLNTIVPAMGSDGPRNLRAAYKISYPYVHVTDYTIS